MSQASSLALVLKLIRDVTNKYIRWGDTAKSRQTLIFIAETCNCVQQLTWVRNVCEAVPRSWFCVPNGLKELPEVTVRISALFRRPDYK